MVRYFRDAFAVAAQSLSPTRSTPSLNFSPPVYHTPYNYQQSPSTPLPITYSPECNPETCPNPPKPDDLPDDLLFEIESKYESAPFRTVVAPQEIFADYQHVLDAMAERKRVLSLPDSDSDYSCPSTPESPSHLELPRVELSPGIRAYALQPKDLLIPVPVPVSVRTNTKRARDDSEDDHIIEKREAKRRAITLKTTTTSVPRRSILSSSTSSGTASRRPALTSRRPAPRRRRQPTRTASNNAPAPNRRTTASSDDVSSSEGSAFVEDTNMEIDTDHDDTDADADFKPNCGTSQRRRPGQKTPSPKKKRTSPKTTTPSQEQLSCGHCRRPDCPICKLICAYVYPYGPRRHEQCGVRIKRDADVQRHQEAHAIHEWFLHRVMDELPAEDANSYYHMRATSAKHSGFICPNHVPGWNGEIGMGDCGALFTRRDALTRHLKSGKGCVTKAFAEELTKDGLLCMDAAAQLSAKLVREWEPIFESFNAKRRAGIPLKGTEKIIFERCLVSKKRMYDDEESGDDSKTTRKTSKRNK